MTDRIRSVNTPVCGLFFAALILAMFSWCLAGSGGQIYEQPVFTSYRDVPGVTAEEIAAITALRSERQGFTFMSLLTTETFMLPGGGYAGFTIELCKLLSELFDIPFNIKIGTWNEALSGLADGTVDFTGEMTPTAERRKTYFMSYPIAQRPLRVFTYGDAVKIENEEDINGLRIGIWAGTITAQYILDAYPGLVFEVVPITGEICEVEMLRRGIIDAFIYDAVVDYGYKSHENVRSRELFSMVYTPVSLTALDPKLEPIISVLNKYIAAGGIHKLFELYKMEGDRYAKYMLQKSFTDEERAYLDGLPAKVPVGLKFDSYPVSFYNEKEKEFQGIAVDVLAEISKLTGIEFEIANAKNAPWAEIFEKFKSGRTLVIADLMVTEERKEHFIWTNTPFFSSRYAFISKMDYPYLEPYQIAHVTVGTVKESVFKDMYGQWFQNSDNLKLFPTMDILFDALENGDVDLILVSESHLLYQTNYREKSGFRINYSFPTSSYSYFGFNRDEEILRSIFDKAMVHVPVDRISKGWTSRMYDYSRKLAEERSVFMTVFTAVLMLMLGLLTFLYLKDRKKRETIAGQASILSAIYNSVPAMLFTKDLNNRYTSCNRKFLEEAQLSEAELIGKDFRDVSTHDKKAGEAFREADLKVINENVTDRMEGWYNYADGPPRAKEIIRTPLVLDGKVAGIRDCDRYYREKAYGRSGSADVGKS